MVNASGMPRILLVDDNPNVRSFVRLALREEGFEVIEGADGETAVYLAERYNLDLIILDVLLNDMNFDGLDVCKLLRQRGIRTPVIFLTVLDRISDSRFPGFAFSIGGDDYIAKRDELLDLEREMRIRPTEFLNRKSDVAELLARVSAILRRQRPGTEGEGLRPLSPRLRADFEGRTVEIFRAGSWVDAGLTGTEISILRTLASQTGRPMGRNQISEAVARERGAGGRAEAFTDRALETHVSRLRRKLETDGSLRIQAVPGIGYRLEIL